MKRSKCKRRIRIVTRGRRERSRKNTEKPKIEHEGKEPGTTKSKKSKLEEEQEENEEEEETEK